MKKQEMFDRMKPRNCGVCGKPCKNYKSENVHMRQHYIEAMEEMECWNAQTHIEKCPKCKKIYRKY